MPNGVLTTKREPAYDDLPEERYHFPRTYLRTMEKLVGNLIVYYESRRSGGRQSYFGSARVVRIEPDQNQPDHFYARIDQYLDFDALVPWRSSSGTCESALMNGDRSTNQGSFQRPV